jgi:hypothetical protein
MGSAYGIANPFPITVSPQLYNIITAFTAPIMLVTVVTVVVSAVVRFRRGQGRERHQMKWLVAGIGVMALLLVTGVMLSSEAGSVIGEILINTSLLGPILGVGVALLRHQLYDIDIIIRRTLVYTVVTALLGIVYFGLVVVLQSVVSAVGGQQSAIVVVISTLAIAALFSPVRQRVQIMIDRRFYRQKYDAARMLSQFATTARDETDLEKLVEAMEEVLGQTVQPKYISLWLRPDQ